MPPGSWDAIALKLDKKKRKGLFFWYSISAAVVLLVATCALWFMHKPKKTELQVSPTEQSAGNNQKAEKAIAENKSDSQDLQASKLHSPQDWHAANQPVVFPKTKVLSKGADDNKILTDQEEQPEKQNSVSSVMDLPEGFGLRTSSILSDLQDRLLPNSLPVAIKELVRKQSAWFVVAGLSGQQGSVAYSVNPANRRYVHKNYLMRMQDGEFSMGGLQFSALAGHKINSRWSLLAGVQYQQGHTRQSFDFKDEVPVTLVPGNKPDKFGNYPIIGYFAGSGSTQYQGFSATSFAEIPVGVMYEITVKKHWLLKPSLTINTGFVSSVSGNTLDYQLLNIAARNQDWFRKTTFSANAGLGIYRKLNERAQWGVSINGSSMLTQTYVPGASIRPRNQAIGLGTQFIWRLNR